MGANMYDQPALALFINTYAPINFGELYRIGAALKEEMNRAADLFGALLLKFGEFKSPSAIDTENYYNNTINRSDFLDAINLMVSNPDAMKDASFRSNLLSLINSVDYSTISLIKQSADNLKARLEMVAKMKAQGKYNPEWDDIDIAQWDTTNKGVMTDLSPIEYMNANQLSNPYFDNLKPGTLGVQWKDGVKYNVTGNNMEDLYSIANAHYNDLMNTPQGQKYYELILKRTNGDQDAAKQLFIDMIASSQIDRTRRPTLTVDPYWLAMAKQSMANKAKQQETKTVLPTRQQMIEKDWSNRVAPKFGNISLDVLKLIQVLVEQARSAYEKYQSTGSDEDYVDYLKSANKAQEIQLNAYRDNMQKIMKEDFSKASNFKLNSDPNKSKEYSRKGYLRGVSYALDEASSTASIRKEDPLLTSLGATYSDYTQQDGLKVGVYLFNNSNGFVLPETVFLFATNTGLSKAKRDAGLFRSDELPFKELVETGRLGSVQFVPETRQNIVQVGTNKLVKGKLRIPVSEIESALGTGILHSLKGDSPTDYFSPTTLFARQSTKRALEENFNSKEVKYGEDGTPFYEVEVYRQLPSDNNGDYWYLVNQLRENSPSHSGVGGSALAAGMQEQSVRTIYDIE